VRLDLRLFRVTFILTSQYDRGRPFIMASLENHNSISRRRVIQLASGVGILKVLDATLPGLSLSQELPAIVQNRGTARNAIIINCSGGMSQMDTLDFKPNASEETRGPFRGVRTRDKKVFFGEPCESLAGIDDRFALLTMEASETGAHNAAFESWLNAAEGGHLVSQLIEKKGGLKYVHGVGPGTHPLMRSESSTYLRSEDAVRYWWDEKAGDFSCNISVRNPACLVERESLRSTLNSLFVISGDQVNRMERHRRQAYDILTTTFSKALNMVGERKKNSENRDPYGELMQLAGRLADPDAGNVPLVVVEGGHFDHHSRLKRRLGRLVPFFRAVAHLILRYGDRVLIAMRGEFGRTPWPQRMKGAEVGRDHFKIHSGLMAGPNVNAIKYGGTSDDGRDIVGNRVTDEEWACTFLDLAGVLPPNKRGKVVQELVRNE
jgi:hypothetical protein